VDKALFIWMLSGIVVAVVVVFHRHIWLRLTWRNAGLAAAGSCVGALPLLAYNALCGFPTFRSNSSFVFNEFRSKAEVLRTTWNGSATMGYSASPISVGDPIEPQGPTERFSFKEPS
jgi:hypothetical protein